MSWSNGLHTTAGPYNEDPATFFFQCEHNFELHGPCEHTVAHHSSLSDVSDNKADQRIAETPKQTKAGKRKKKKSEESEREEEPKPRVKRTRGPCRTFRKAERAKGPPTWLEGPWNASSAKHPPPVDPSALSSGSQHHDRPRRMPPIHTDESEIHQYARNGPLLPQQDGVMSTLWATPDMAAAGLFEDPLATLGLPCETDNIYVATATLQTIGPTFPSPSSPTSLQNLAVIVEPQQSIEHDQTSAVGQDDLFWFNSPDLDLTSIFSLLEEFEARPEEDKARFFPADDLVCDPSYEATSYSSDAALTVQGSTQQSCLECFDEVRSAAPPSPATDARSEASISYRASAPESPKSAAYASELPRTLRREAISINRRRREVAISRLVVYAPPFLPPTLT
ncbi:hypothetical protein CI109_103244 [Kwoniella shandongensis]|uniref:Uncharacterized protein n=1 Tax=Kwoniella shandongensis TaxID=1734106 RepID=A0A5M6BS42_9TREE|nr:uncharacterized protein CI109_006084 [Kwoniella shandongensis]KAA5525633.1 hypothetical protein CI109_006084 [Kwoniella shandongensis]